MRILLRELYVHHNDSMVCHTLSVLSFNTELNYAEICLKLNRGESIKISNYTIKVYEKEEPSVIMTDQPMALYINSDGEISLSLS